MTKQDHVARRTTGVVKTNEPTGLERIYAMRVLDGSMAPRVSKGETIYCDPGVQPGASGRLVVVRESRTAAPVLRELEIKGRRRYLRCLKPSSARPLRAGGKVLAVVVAKFEAV